MPYNHTATGSPNERELRPEEMQMTKIHCRCVGCKAVRVYTDDDQIDEAGPHCEVCFMPMIPFKIEREVLLA